MALDDGESLQVKEIVSQEIERSLQKRIPRLIRIEEFAKPLVAGIALAIAFPAVLYGVKHYAENQARATFAELYHSDSVGPMSKLKHFSKGLKETFEGQVDSATFKMLRFGCNIGPVNAAANFPPCGGASSAATLQAKDALDEEEQTIAFAARPQQNVKLALVLRPVDARMVLDRVALQIDWMPLDIRGSNRERAAKPIPLGSVKITKKDYLLKGPKGHLLRLYGMSNDGVTGEPLNLEVDLTDALKEITTSLHQVRIRAVQDPESKERSNGTERFFIRAFVSVNHMVSPLPEAKQ